MSVQTKKISLVNAIILSLLMLVIGYSVGQRSDVIENWWINTSGQKPAKSKLSYRSLDQIYQELIKEYDGKIDRKQLIQGAKKGMVASLGDPYTVYFTPEEAKEFDKSLSGDVGAGIGAEMRMINNLPTIVRPIEGNPSYKAGLEPYDVVMAVDDKTVAGEDLDQVVTRIKGKPGTEVKLEIARKGENKPLEFVIKRAVIKNPSVLVEYKDDTAIIRLSRFDNHSYSLIKKAAAKLSRSGYKKLVLDLRSNPGGYLDSAKQIAGLWIDQKKIVTEKRADGKLNYVLYSESGDNDFDGVKTVVLINQASASASEILAAALKYYKKATVIGEKSFGKGSVQQMSVLPYGGKLKMTVARWYTPADKNIDKNGIEPDIKVDLSIEDWRAGRDPQLKAALDFLNKK